MPGIRVGDDAGFNSTVSERLDPVQFLAYILRREDT